MEQRRKRNRQQQIERKTNNPKQIMSKNQVRNRHRKYRPGPKTSDNSMTRPSKDSNWETKRGKTESKTI